MRARINARVIRDHTGVAAEIPVVLTQDGPLEPLVDYFLERSNRSWSWKDKVVRGVGLLLDYMAANEGVFEKPKELFQTFVQRLYTGTINEEDGLDPSGLYWRPVSASRVNGLVHAVSEFSDWMADRLEAAPVNPLRAATGYEERLHWAAWHHQHNRAFLAHTWERDKASGNAQKSRHAATRRRPKSNSAGVKFFPESRIFDLLFQGFLRPGQGASPQLAERLNLRDILITILLHGGGLRVSEPFHLYVHDVRPDPYDPDVALVRVYHPEEGTAPSDWKDEKGRPIACRREAYLRGKYGMRPRTQYADTDGLHAGWKDPKLDDPSAMFLHVHWFPRDWGRLFKKLWDLYLLQLAQIDRGHPFAFVSFHPKWAGRPYSLDSYRENHGKAVAAIGLIPAKMEGTTPHGHRHATGQRLLNAKVDARFVRAVLHHKSVESQLVYSEPTIAAVTRALDAATERAEGRLAAPLPDLTAYGFEDVDPLGLFSGPRPRLRRPD
jgi:hypothetical protein